jgi:hypothetical protein
VRDGPNQPRRPEARHERVCRLCGMLGVTNPPVEHLMHFVLECPLYHHIRECYSPLFMPPQAFSSKSERMLYIFDTKEHQRQLMRCLRRMTQRREHCLDANSTVGGPDAPAHNYVPSPALLAALENSTLPNEGLP